MWRRVTHFYANEKLTYAATPKKDYIVDHTIAELETSSTPPASSAFTDPPS